MRKILIVLSLILMTFTFTNVNVFAGGEAKIGDTSYSSLQEAINSIDTTNRTNIDLLADVSTSNTITISNDKNIKLNLNGHTITSSANKTIDSSGTLIIDGNNNTSSNIINSSTESTATVVYSASGTITLINNANTSISTSDNHYVFNGDAGTTITVSGGNHTGLIGTNGASIKLVSGNYYCKSSPSSYVPDCSTISKNEDDEYYSIVQTKTDFTITYVYNNNTSNTSTLSSTIVFPSTNPTYDGYTFDGWYTDSSFTNLAISGDPIFSDITLYAKWEENINQSINISWTTTPIQVIEKDIYTWDASELCYKVSETQNSQVPGTINVYITNNMNSDINCTVDYIDTEGINITHSKEKTTTSVVSANASDFNAYSDTLKFSNLDNIGNPSKVSTYSISISKTN